MCQVRKCARVRMLINTVNTFRRTPRRDWRKEIPVVEQRDISVNFYLPHVELHLTCLLLYSASCISNKGPFIYVEEELTFFQHSQYFSFCHVDINVPIKSATLIPVTHKHAQTHNVLSLLFSASINLSFPPLSLCTVYLFPIFLKNWPVFHSCWKTPSLSNWISTVFETLFTMARN